MAEQSKLGQIQKIQYDKYWTMQITSDNVVQVRLEVSDDCEKELALVLAELVSDGRLNKTSLNVLLNAAFSYVQDNKL